MQTLTSVPLFRRRIVSTRRFTSSPRTMKTVSRLGERVFATLLVILQGYRCVFGCDCVWIASDELVDCWMAHITNSTQKLSSVVSSGKEHRSGVEAMDFAMDRRFLVVLSASGALMWCVEQA